MSRDIHSSDKTIKKHKGSDDCGHQRPGTATGHVGMASGMTDISLFLDLSRGYTSI